MNNKCTNFEDTEGNQKKRYRNEWGIIDVNSDCPEETIKALEKLQEKVVKGWYERNEREKKFGVPFIRAKQIKLEK